ncbi:MAG: FecCD family ABC transporter permease [Planctomycetota bacterium]|jgi:iron complex transport system permease protein
MLTGKKLTIRLLIAGLVLLAVSFIGLLVGSEVISPMKILEGPNAEVPNVDFEIFLYVRLPRVFLACIVGAALACSGVVFQAILRNPLADPYILGISSGAGLGTMIAVFFGWTIETGLWGFSPMMACAFAGAMLTVWLVWAIGRVTGREHVTGLLLAGVVVNAFLSAMIMFLSSIIDASELQSVIFRLMGNFQEFNCVLPLMASFSIVLAGIIVLTVMSGRLNILSFGAEDAQSLGVSVEKTTLISFACAALITSIAVSLSGLIGFVGLIVPHAVRLVAGPDHRQLVPLSAIIGAAFLVGADAIARVLVANEILPVGVVTALAGGPFFLFLLIRYTKSIHWGKS